MKDFRNYIRDVHNFPKEGILFKDLTPLWQDHEAFTSALDALLVLTSGLQIDKVIGVESRGFIFAPAMALKLQAGFVPVRKKGKLPSATISEEYALEYSTDNLEIHKDAIKPGEKVLIHDDVLATGGTAEAVCKLVERLGGIVVQCNFVMEISVLNGLDKLHGFKVSSLIKY